MPISKQKRSPDAIASLKADHKKVKGLFEKFEKAKDHRTKKTIATEALEELGDHIGIKGAQQSPEFVFPSVK